MSDAQEMGVIFYADLVSFHKTCTTSTRASDIFKLGYDHILMTLYRAW